MEKQQCRGEDRKSIGIDIGIDIEIKTKISETPDPWQRSSLAVSKNIT